MVSPYDYHRPTSTCTALFTEARRRDILIGSSKEVATWHTKICHVAYMICPVPTLQSDPSSSRAPSVPSPSRERPGFSLACASGPGPYRTSPKRRSKKFGTRKGRGAKDPDPFLPTLPCRY